MSLHEMPPCHVWDIATPASAILLILKEPVRYDIDYQVVISCLAPFTNSMELLRNWKR